MAIQLAGFEATKEVAEGVVKRAMTPLRKIIAEYKEEPDGSVEATITLHEVRSIDADLGIIGSILATLYHRERDFELTTKVLAAENVKLDSAVNVLARKLVEAENDIETLANRLTKTETVNDKLKKVVPSVKPAFKAPDRGIIDQ